MRNTCLTGGSVGPVGGAVVLSFDCCGADCARAGAGAGVETGAGVELTGVDAGAGGVGAGVVAVGVVAGGEYSATTTGKALCSAGLTAVPSTTPNASRLITATAATRGLGSEKPPRVRSSAATAATDGRGAAVTKRGNG